MKSVPTTCFAVYGMVSDEFQRGLKPCGFRGVSEGSETVWFQRGLEGSETVWFQRFQRGFRGI